MRGIKNIIRETLSLNLDEALPISTAKKLMAYWNDNIIKEYDKIFGSGVNRLYFNIDGDKLEYNKKKKQFVGSSNSGIKNESLEDRILKAILDSDKINKSDVGELDFNDNKISYKGNDMKLTKLLARLKLTDLAKEFNDYLSKEKKVENTEDSVIVISRHPYDIGGMSTDREWDSCMNLVGGSNKEFVYADIEKGSIISYLVDKDDPNINKPISRVLIKPFLSTTDENEYILRPEKKTYGKSNPDFYKFIMTWCEKETHGSGVYNLQCKLYPDSDSGNKDYVVLKDFQSQKKYIDDLLIKNSNNIKSTILDSFETIGNQMKADTLHYLLNNNIDLIFYKLISNYKDKKIEFMDDSRIVMDESEKQKALSKNAYYFLRIENSAKEDIKRGLQKALSEDDLYVLEEYQTWYNYLDPKDIIILLTKKDEDGEFLELYLDDAIYNLSVIKAIHNNTRDWFEKEDLSNKFLNKISRDGITGNKNEIGDFVLSVLKPSNKTLMDSPNLLQYLPKEKRDELIDDMVTIKTDYKSTLYEIFKNPKYKKEKKNIILKLLGLGKRNELLETIYNTTEINSDSKLKMLPILLNNTVMNTFLNLRYIDDEVYKRLILKFVEPFDEKSVIFNKNIDYDKDKATKQNKFYHYNKQIGAVLSLFKRIGKKKDNLDFYSFEGVNNDVYDKIHDILTKNIETK